MPTPRLLLTALFATVLLGPALLAVEKEINRVFAVEPGCLLALDTYRGAILIEESDENQVRVQISIDAVAATDASAERLLNQVQVDFSQQENRVTLRARNPRESGIRFTWSEEDRVDLTFKISVPRQCDVDIRAINGSLTVGNLRGRMKARVENGSVFFRRIEGSVEAQVDYGDIIVSRCSGAVSARTLRGTLRFGTLGGPAHLKNSTGDIEVMAVAHSVTAEAEVGEVRLGFAPGQAADSRVKVSGGNLVASFHTRLACQIDAAASWGRVSARLPLKIESGGDGKRSLIARYNEGGPRIHLRASGGSVTLERGLLMTDDEG